MCGRNYAELLEVDTLSFTPSLSHSLFSFSLAHPLINIFNKILLLRCARQRTTRSPKLQTSLPLSLFPSPFPACVPLFASTSVLVPAPFPSPSRFLSPFPPPPPFPSPFPPPTPILSSTPFAPSSPSNPVTHSVRCPFTDTRDCEQSCRVPASVTPCLQR